MAQQIKKKFIGADQIDGSKIKLLKDQAVRGQKQDGSEVELLKLDGSDKLVHDGQEIAFKSQLDSEEQARIAGDQQLQSQIDTEKSRVDAILLASDADKNSFAEIVELINSVDTENDSAFASYVLSNNAALAQEVSDRQAGDQSLQSEIEAEETRAMGEESRIESKFDGMMSTETAARIAGDESLEDMIDSEAQARMDGDSVLQSNLNQEISDRQAAVSAEQSARESADSSLQSQITQEVSDRQSAVSAEASARQSADTTLQSNIDAEEVRAMGVEAELQSDLENLDGYAQDIRSDLDQEILDRAAAVSAEASARIAADQQLESSISAEASARIAADLVLEGLVSSEASARSSADQQLQSSIDIEKGRIDAILSASEADKDSFAEIVSLINSVDTENDQAFAGYVSSNNAAVSALQSGLSQEILDRQAADALKEDLANKSSDSAMGESNTLYPTQKAVKDHVIASQSIMSRKLLTGEGIDSLVPADINVETADRHYSGAVAHALNPGYVCYFTDSAFVFVDARNPFAVNIYKTLTFSTASNNFPQTITAIGNYLLVATSNGRVYTIDWSDINNPSIFGFKTIGSGQHYDMTTDGANTLFLANTTNNCVYAVDITDRTNPTLINQVALGGFGTGVAFNAGYLYVTNYSNKLHTLQKNVTSGLWEQVAVLNTITNPNRCRIVENVRGDKLLFAMRYNGTDAVFYSISTPAAPVESKRLVTSSPMQIYAVPFSHENMVHVGFDNGTVGGFSIVDITDVKFAGSYTPVNSDGSKKFSSMRVLVKTSTKSPYFKDKALLLASGVRTGGTSAQKTTAPIQLPVINHDSVELLARPTSSSVSGSIASEAQIRSDADIALSSRISVLEGKGFNKGVVIVGSELGYIDLDRQYSILLSVTVGRLAVHEGVDYTTSVIAGKTRLTWIGSLVNPGGNEPIETGDNVFFSGAF
jgi:hypothetical protein